LLIVTVLRSDISWSENDLHDYLTVDLVKKPGKGLGLSIVGRRHNTGVVIADIVKGGTAESDGRLSPGDQIVKVNGEDVCHMTQECAAALLKTLMGKVSLTIARLKSGLIPVSGLVWGWQ
jgi:multiple PDZ domain protein